jgi:hypothetical protein
MLSGQTWDNLERLGMDGTITLKWMPQKYGANWLSKKSMYIKFWDSLLTGHIITPCQKTGKWRALWRL